MNKGSHCLLPSCKISVVMKRVRVRESCRLWAGSYQGRKKTLSIPEFYFECERGLF